jgi:hypothetical protein
MEAHWLHALRALSNRNRGMHMVFEVVKRWFRYRVYSLGHTDGDRFWLASFRHREHATLFVLALQGYPTSAGDPFDEVKQ